jgi:hypothetical protein
MQEQVNLSKAKINKENCCQENGVVSEGDLICRLNWSVKSLNTATNYFPANNGLINFLVSHLWRAKSPYLKRQKERVASCNKDCHCGVFILTGHYSKDLTPFIAISL